MIAIRIIVMIFIFYNKIKSFPSKTSRKATLFAMLSGQFYVDCDQSVICIISSSSHIPTRVWFSWYPVRRRTTLGAARVLYCVH